MRRISIIAIISSIIILSNLSAHSINIARCLLQHKGNVTLFDASDISRAMTASQDGDTIFLTTGDFPGFTINKKITVRGAGEQTIITDDIIINIPGSPSLNQTLLEGLYSGSDVKLSSVMSNVKIKQCTINRLLTNANNYNIIVDRCDFRNASSDSEIAFSDYIKEMTINNSRVRLGKNFKSIVKDNKMTFVNCYVWANYINDVRGTFINSIINGEGWNNQTTSTAAFSYCNFLNCLLSGNYIVADTTCKIQNCYKDKDAVDFPYDKLMSLGYLGTDNTVVGSKGGATPFTLELAIPKVTDSKISVDNDNKLLIIDLKVTAQ